MASSIETTLKAEELLNEVMKDAVIKANPYHPDRIKFSYKEAHLRKRRLLWIIKEGLK